MDFYFASAAFCIAGARMVDHLDIGCSDDVHLVPPLAASPALVTVPVVVAFRNSYGILPCGKTSSKFINAEPSIEALITHVAPEQLPTAALVYMSTKALQRWGHLNLSQVASWHCYECEDIALAGSVGVTHKSSGKFKMGPLWELPGATTSITSFPVGFWAAGAASVLASESAEPQNWDIQV